MALFGFGKKKEEGKKNGCCCSTSVQGAVVETACSCNRDTEGYEASTPLRCSGTGKTCSITSMKVLGAGCKSCHEQYENCMKAVTELGLELEVEYITDMDKVMAYGVMSMPGIVVNEKILSMGKVLKPAEVIKLLEKQGYC